MRFNLWTAVVTASLSIASTIDNISLEKKTIEERSTSQCGVKGSWLSLGFFSSTQKNLAVPAQCGALCKSKALCQAYAVDANGCYLYLLPVTKLTFKKNQAGSLAFYNKACATSSDLCWITGNTVNSAKPLKTSSNFVDSSWTGCSALCKNTAGCESYTLGSGSCTLYNTPLAKILSVNSRSKQAFWDVNCPLSAATLPPPPAPPASVQQQILAASASAALLPQVASPVTFSAFSSYTPLVTDSPPLPSMSQPPFGGYSDDNAFTDSYTYTEFPLPTPTVLGSPPITTGFAGPASTDLPSAPCLVSTGPAAQFTLLNENYIPLVSLASNQLGPVPQPTQSPAPSNPLSQNPDAIIFPGFYLSAPAGAPDNTYDLVYAGSSSPLYVALQPNGNVVLRPASTGPNFVGGFATTIFTVNCFGLFAISQGGQVWNWATNGATTEMTQGGSSTTRFVALPANLPAVQNAKRDRVRNVELSKKLKKRGPDQDGDAPRCPNRAGFPQNLVSHTKQGYQEDQGNMCDNMSDYWSLSPFDFDDSCAVQSLCYDQCEGWGWDTCNGIFGGLMFAGCADEFDSWWDVVTAVACAAQASYWIAVAATSHGRDVFYQAQSAMCACFCPAPTSECVFPDGSFYCSNLFDTDNNNCGACGRQCPPGTTCNGGQCGCIGDQCGNTCLDLRNNPNNCGSCGATCDPQYCVAGSCYVPQPGQCTPDPPIQDPDIYPFAHWGITDLQQPGCTYGSNVNIGGASLTTSSGNYQTISYITSNMPGSGCAEAIYQQSVKLCPGFLYTLTFNALYLSGFQQNGVDIPTGAPCQITWGLGQPDGTDFGSYQSHTWGVSDADYIQYSGWNFNINNGDPGVTTSDGSSFVNLYAVLQCTGSGNGGFVVGSVDIEQIGTV